MLAATAVVACKADAQATQARDAPPLALTGRVVDRAEIMDSRLEASLSKRLGALEKDTGVQFVVVTTPSLLGRDIKDYAMALGNGWGLGDARRDDGLLLVVAPNERKVRISPGHGLEDELTDAECAAIVEQILPYFRAGDLPGGTLYGADALDKAVRAELGNRT